MKTNKIFAALATTLTLFAGMLATVPNAAAAPVTFTAFGTSTSFTNVAVDPITGKVYVRSDYSTASVKVYANAAAFASGTVLNTVTLAAPIYGSYFAVNNGQLYGRTSTSTTAVATFSTATGAITSTLAAYAGMGGVNFTDTFNWGGYSGANFMQDYTGMYVFGGVAANSNWQIQKLDAGLASSSTTIYNTANQLGFGFIINGILFTGDSYSSGAVTTAMNLSTGTVSAVNDPFIGMGSNFYMSDFSYDYASDTLYATNYYSNTFFKASNASVQFNAPRAAEVPEPGSVMLLGLGIAALTLARRKQRSA
jgi:hypothetical protein